ncbi:MAG: YicC family protein [Desulfobacteraceae bacterium]|nr:YicC family protein [Desulfobacteraceae bacterium]
MIKSMTGFARSDYTNNGVHVTAEIRSYNSRNLDMVFRLPHVYQPLEERIRSLISVRIARGRVEVNLQIKDDATDEQIAYEIDFARIRAFHQALISIKKELKLDSPVTIDHLTSIPGMIKPGDVEGDVEGCWPVVQACLERTLAEVSEMREREGEFLLNDFTARLGYIESQLGETKKLSNGLVNIYKERLERRIGELTNGIVELDPSRIAQEAAILSDRSDISEEIVRAESHIEQFRTIMVSGEPTGRKLNFLLQELNREFNTMGSKCGKSEISHIIVNIKSELEKLREQVQNIE